MNSDRLANIREHATKHVGGEGPFWQDLLRQTLAWGDGLAEQIVRQHKDTAESVASRDELIAQLHSEIKLLKEENAGLTAKIPAQGTV